MQGAFLYLRTKLAIQNETPTFVLLAKTFPYYAMVSVSVPARYARDPLRV